jgi:hypothetical protein
MELERLPSAVATPPSSKPARIYRGSTAQSIVAVEQRLASAEHELRVQFTRIAQLQAEVDLVRAELRRSPEGGRRHL